MTRILMIDDDADMCAEMSEILEDAGIEVTAVCDPAAGMRSVRENAYDLLLLDLKMPGINGYDILSAVKQRMPGLKVMVITGAPIKKIPGGASSKEDRLKENILALADEVVNKSVDIETILQKIRRLAQQS